MIDFTPLTESDVLEAVSAWLDGRPPVDETRKTLLNVLRSAIVKARQPRYVFLFEHDGTYLFGLEESPRRVQQHSGRRNIELLHLLLAGETVPYNGRSPGALRQCLKQAARRLAGHSTSLGEAIARGIALGPGGARFVQRGDGPPLVIRTR